MISQNKRFVILMSLVCLILAIPLIAMQFTKEVNWSFFDFLVAGLLLSGAALLSEFILRKVKTRKSRILLVAIVAILLILVWLELAVGVFGSVFAGS